MLRVFQNTSNEDDFGRYAHLLAVKCMTVAREIEGFQHPTLFPVLVTGIQFYASAWREDLIYKPRSDRSEFREE